MATTWEIVNESCNINITNSGVSVDTLPKEIVTLAVILASTHSDINVDSLQIIHDGSYASLIPYNDVTISAGIPVSVEDFRTSLVNLLNSNPCASGGGGTPNLMDVLAQGNDADATQIKNIADATDALDAVNKGQLDDVNTVAQQGVADAAMAQATADNAQASADNATVIASVADAKGDNALAQIAALPVLEGSVYAPDIGIIANLDSVTSPGYALYSRVGNIVTVSGRLQANPTLAATLTELTISLPIASTLDNDAADASGVGACGNIAGMSAQIFSDNIDGKAHMKWIASDVTNKDWSYTFQYIIN